MKTEITITCLLFLFFLAPSLGKFETFTNECDIQYHLPTLSEGMLPYNKDKTNLSIEEKIFIVAKLAGVDYVKALSIAKCESSFNKNARSKISSAKGLYQFIDKTWLKYCVGDVFNEDDNIACFLNLYPKNPSWWECK